MFDDPEKHEIPDETPDETPDESPDWETGEGEEGEEASDTSWYKEEPPEPDEQPEEEPSGENGEEGEREPESLELFGQEVQRQNVEDALADYYGFHNDLETDPAAAVAKLIEGRMDDELRRELIVEQAKDLGLEVHDHEGEYVEPDNSVKLERRLKALEQENRNLSVQVQQQAQHASQKQKFQQFLDSKKVGWSQEQQNDSDHYLTQAYNYALARNVPFEDAYDLFALRAAKTRQGKPTDSGQQEPRRKPSPGKKPESAEELSLGEQMQRFGAARLARE